MNRLKRAAITVRTVWRRIPVWGKWLAMMMLMLVGLYQLHLHTPYVREALSAVGSAHPGWVAGCLVASALSMLSFAGVQHTLLGAAGVKSRLSRNLVIVLASNALSGSIPGGPVLGTALTYRETRKLGASPVVAGWQLVISGILATLGLVLLGLGGFVFLGTITSPVVLVLSLISLVAVFAVVQWMVTHPHLIEKRIHPILVWIWRKRRKDPSTVVTALHRTITQAEAVKVPLPKLGAAFAWSLFNWVADVACMGCAAYAVGARPTVGGMAIAYVSGKVVGSAPITPGGMGTVDGTLTWALTLGGLTGADSLATVLIYRLISFGLVVAIGWILVGVLFRGATQDSSLLETFTKETSDMDTEH